MQDISRRGLVSIGFGGLAAAALPLSLGRAAGRAFAESSESQQDEPHFFLQVMVPFGMDPTYMFDARPLAMTQAGKLQNYLGEEPSLWTGANGETCWATSLVKPLAAYREDFSILNGVLMATVFDGHDQNLNYFFTGNPFGGESFIPFLNQGSATKAPLPLDFVDSGFFKLANITNGAASAPLSAQAAKNLANQLKKSPAMNAQSKLGAFLRSRMEVNATGSGKFSAASRAMQGAYDKAPGLSELLKAVDPNVAETDQVTLALEVVTQMFSKGAAKSAIISIFPTQFVDTHDAASARKQPEIYAEIVGKIVKIMAYLKNSAFDQTRSMFDVTTLLVGSEFGRTMRHAGLPIDATGTDHNPLTNSMLVGGKGIKSGLVIGSSDSRTPEETLSGVHRSFDPEHFKMMGRPFDFETMRSREDLPSAFVASEYLTLPSVINTIYTAFGVDESKQWLTERNGTKARVVRTLLG